jgi:SAM-dependent methyltransferase
MRDEHQRLLEIFWDVQRGLPRQGPGATESTLKALALCTGLPARLTLLDIGCGPGMQTVALAAALPEAHITAVDIHQKYLDELRERAKAARVAARIDILAGDMQALPFPPQRFDLIWAEGAAYIMGCAQALSPGNSSSRPGVASRCPSWCGYGPIRRPKSLRSLAGNIRPWLT